MRIYPDEDLARGEWDNVHYVDSCERARCILLNPLNEEVVYRRAHVLFMEVRLRQSQHWMPQVVRRYNVEWAVGEWAIGNYNNTMPMPNTMCPICRRYSTISEYSGANVLNIVCTGCVEHDQPDWINLTDDNWGIDLNNWEVHPLPIDFKNEKVNWAVEGF